MAFDKFDNEEASTLAEEYRRDNQAGDDAGLVHAAWVAMIAGLQQMVATKKDILNLVVTDVENTTIVGFIARQIGCGNCGRYGLYSESHDSVHTRGWQKFICPSCKHEMRFPVRDLRTPEEVAAES